MQTPISQSLQKKNNCTSQPMQVSDIDPIVLEEAADWLTLIYSDDATEQDKENLLHWQNKSVMHQAAWQKAEQILGTFSKVPASVGRSTLSQLDNVDRRKALKACAVLLMATPTTWLAYKQLPWQNWQADLHTSTGEQQKLNLADGTQLVLNTNTVVNVNFSPQIRRLTLLQGEILITTAKEHSSTYRPFIVHSQQGQLQALGTRFSVRQFDGSTQLAVFDGAVEITAKQYSEKVVVEAGQQRNFTATHIQASNKASTNSYLWEKGMILAKNMPVSTLISELSRYRTGVLRCDPNIADMRVSGAFPVDNTNTSLELLQQTLPIQVTSLTPWWVTVKAK